MSQQSTTNDGVTRDSRTRWPIEAKVRAIGWKDDGKTTVEAFATVAAEFHIELKRSYLTTVGAHSHLYRFRNEINVILTNRSHRHHTEAVASCSELELLDEDDDPTDAATQ